MISHVVFCDVLRVLPVVVNPPGSQAEPLESRNVVALPVGAEEAHGAPASALHQLCHRVPAKCFKMFPGHWLDIGPNGWPKL